MFLLHQLATESAERNPTQVAVVGPGGSLSYGQFERFPSSMRALVTATHRATSLSLPVRMLAPQAVER